MSSSCFLLSLRVRLNVQDVVRMRPTHFPSAIPARAENCKWLLQFITVPPGFHRERQYSENNNRQLSAGCGHPRHPHDPSTPTSSLHEWMLRASTWTWDQILLSRARKSMRGCTWLPFNRRLIFLKRKFDRQLGFASSLAAYRHSTRNSRAARNHTCVGPSCDAGKSREFDSRLY